MARTFLRGLVRRIGGAALMVLCLGAVAGNLAALAQQPAPVTASPGLAVPPPRTITDILAVLDNQRPDPAQVAALQAQVRAEPPPGLGPTEQAKHYFERSVAAGELGLFQQQLLDAQRADKIASDNNLTDDAIAYRMVRARAEQSVGNLRQAEAMYRELIARFESEDLGNRGRLFSMYTSSALFAVQAGDFVAAEALLAKADSLYGEARRWRHGASLAMYGNSWHSIILRGHAALLAARGRLDEALRALREAQGEVDQAIVKQPGWVDKVTPLAQLQQVRDSIVEQTSRVLRLQGRLMEAEIEARGALLSELQRRGRYAPEGARAIASLADVIAEEGRLAEAGLLYKATVDSLEGSGISEASTVMASARAGYARSLVAQGRLADGLAQYERARRGFADDPALQLRLVDGTPPYNYALVRGGRSGEAVANLTRALERNQASQGGDSFLGATLLGYRGMALAAAGDRARALADFDAALPALLSVSRGDESSADSPTNRDQVRRNVFEAHLASLADLAGTPAAGGRDIAAETFRLADAIRGQSVQRALAESSARAAARDPALAELARREQDAQKQIAALYQVINGLLAGPSDQQDPGVVRSLRSQIDALRDQRAQLRQEIERRFPRYAELIDPRPAAIAEVRAALRPGEALIATYVGPDRSYVWALTKTGPVAFAAPRLGGAQIAALVAELRRSLDPSAGTLGEIPVFDLVASYKLYSQLLDPVKSGWQGAGTLIVVPHGPLGEIPFSVLVTDPARPVEERAGQVMFQGYKTVAFLVRKAAITQLPSVNALVTLRAVPPPPAGRRAFAGFGDPWFSPRQAAQAKAAAARTQLAAVSALQVRGMPLRRRSAPATERAASADLAQLPRLPDTAEEVRSVAAALNADPASDVFLGARASIETVRTLDLANRRVVMFATHGLVPGDLDGLSEPALALSAPSVAGGGGDGLLRMDDIVGLHLDADWVVLSACNTAAAEGAGAEAVSGLGRAFFYAGTRAVLVSNWPVETISARMLTTDLFRRQAADPTLSRADALRQAELGLIEGEGFVDPTTRRTVFAYAHPIFWAPFSVVGDGGGGRSGG